LQMMNSDVEDWKLNELPPSPVIENYIGKIND